MEQELIQAGQRFRFKEPQEAIWFNNPFGGSFGYQLPASWAKREYRSDLLTEIFLVPPTMIFWAQSAYWSLAGFYCVRGLRIDNGQVFNLMQGDRRLVSFHNLLPEEVPAVEIVKPDIEETLVIGTRTYDIWRY